MPYYCLLTNLTLEIVLKVFTTHEAFLFSSDPWLFDDVFGKQMIALIFNIVLAFCHVILLSDRRIVSITVIIVYNEIQRTMEYAVNKVYQRE